MNLNGFYTTHLVQFYETDLMGIVHHTNYLRFMEEARVAWAHQRGFIDYQKPESAAQFAVLETNVKHIKPALFGDQLQIFVEAKLLGQARIQFQYQIFKKVENKSIPQTNSQSEKVLVCSGTTIHVALDPQLQPMRIPKTMKTILENEKWTEI